MTIRSLEPLYALSVHQPWASCISHGWKLIENRGWRPPANIMGRELAIHATKAHADRWEVAHVRELLARHHRFALPRDITWTHGAIVAVVRVVGVVLPAGEGCPPSQRHWHVPGQYGWLLSDVRPLAKPLQVRGQQGVWPVPGEIVHLAREQISESRSMGRAASGRR